MDQPTPPGPGWYPDATDPSRERWFDGADWSPVTRSSAVAPSPAVPSSAVPPPPGVPWGTPPAASRPPGGDGEQPPADGARPGPATGPVTGPNPYPGPNPYAMPNPYAAPPLDRYPSGDGPDGPQLGPPQQSQFGPPQLPTQQPPPFSYGPGRLPATGPTTPDGVPLAALWLRLVARFLDLVITWVLTAGAGAYYLAQMMKMVWPVWVAAAEGQPGAELEPVLNDPAFIDLALRYTFVGLLVGGVYFVVLTHLVGGTLGKLMAGIRVRSWDGPGRPTWGQALARWLTREVIAQISFAGIGFVYWIVDSLWLLWDPRRQCLHDKLPATVVVRHR